MMRTSSRLLALLLLLAAPALSAQDSARVTPARWEASIPLESVVGVVGKTPILWSDVLAEIAKRRAQGLQLPADEAAQRTLAQEVLDALVDEEVLVQRAQADTTVKVTDADVQAQVEQQVRRVRQQFKTEPEFREALRQNGLGTPDEYRRRLTEDLRRRQLQSEIVQRLKQAGKMVPVAVSEAEVDEAYEKNRASLPKRPATLAFYQVVVAPTADDGAKAVARAKAERILGELRNGADFEALAKRESQDPGSGAQGGDLGWNRRGLMVPQFDRVMFALQPGRLSPVVETIFGFHIIRVDRVQPGEVKARHILITPTVDSADVVRARALADSVAALWKGRRLPFDSLVARYHDPREERGSVQPFDRSQLPEPYQQAFGQAKKGDVVGPFEIRDARANLPKFVVAEVLSTTEAGDYTREEFRATVRDQLVEEKSIRRLLDALRRETYVAVRLPEKLPTPLD